LVAEADVTQAARILSASNVTVLLPGVIVEDEERLTDTAVLFNQLQELLDAPSKLHNSLHVQDTVLDSPP
jgi:hypothetical protein